MRSRAGADEPGRLCLALAYFDEPGLPRALDRIPLAYFTRAARWLGRQPGADARALTVWGDSRGSEAALLLGADFPGLVHAVIAGSPSSVTYGAVSLRYPHRDLVFPGAGHGAGGAFPYDLGTASITTPTRTLDLGGTPVVNSAAGTKAWRDVLTFLQHLTPD